MDKKCDRCPRPVRTKDIMTIRYHEHYCKQCMHTHITVEMLCPRCMSEERKRNIEIMEEAVRSHQ